MDSGGISVMLMPASLVQVCDCQLLGGIVFRLLITSDLTHKDTDAQLKLA